MKKLLAACLLTATLTFTGCAFMDGLIMERATTEQGEPLFVDNDGELTTLPADPATGEEFAPAYTSNESEQFKEVKKKAEEASGPFAPIIAGVLGLFSTIYMAVRGRRKVKAAEIIGDTVKKLADLALRIYSDYSNGVLDLDDDGMISAEEVRKYALESGVPMEAVVEMLEIAKLGLPPTDAQKKLDEIVEKYAGS